MKNDRIRAPRSGSQQVRRYNVSPVSRAIRSVLTLSAAALAFSGTGAALASTPQAKTPSAPPLLSAQRTTLADLANHQIPSTVVDLTAVSDANMPTSVVAGVFDLHASLADPSLQLAANDIGRSFIFPGSPVSGVTFPGFSYSAYSPDGYAIGLLIVGDSIDVTNGWDLDAVGYTLAIGADFQAINGDSTMANTGIVNATATGDNGLAIALYSYGTGDSAISNSGDISATSTGIDGRALGAWSIADAGNASVDNTGSITVSAAGFGFGVGAYALSSSGDATATNDGTMKVDAYYATGLSAISTGDGHATADNSGTINVNGNYWAYALVASSLGGGDSTASNSGSLAASALGNAYGMFALGDKVDATNTGDIVANSVFLTATGIHAEGGTSTSVANDGSVGAYGTYGAAYGIYATGDNVHVDNQVDGVIHAATGGDYAAGILAAGNVVDLTNAGALTSDSNYLSAGVFTLGGDLTVDNSGSIDAHAGGSYGTAFGVFANGANVDVHNSGTINADGVYATGVDARGTGTLSVDNDRGAIYAEGTIASAILARNSGEGGTATVTNEGLAYAYGDVFASGIEAIARAYQGTASVTNDGAVYAMGANADVQGIVAAADLEASVFNNGFVRAQGGGSAYGVLVISADGDTTVANTGAILAYAEGRDGIAYGVAMQTNNGLASVTNDYVIHAIGTYSATGIYAATKWNDVEVTNNHELIAVAYADQALGIQAITYTGEANVTNNGLLGAYAAYAAVGAWGISLYGDANVVNTGDIETFGGALDRGMIARTLYGGTASIDNSGDVNTYSGASSYGGWSRSDSGAAVVHNSGSISAHSVNGYGYGVISGGFTGSSVTNDATGIIRGFGGYAGGGILAYSNGGDTSVTNAGESSGLSYGEVFGIRASARVGTATVTNASTGLVQGQSMYGNAFAITVDAGVDALVTNNGALYAASEYGIADGIFAGAGDDVAVDNNATGTITAYGNNWAAGIEATAGDAVNATNHGDITAQANGRANGIFAYGANSAKVINDGDIHATAGGVAFGVYGYSYGTTTVTNCNCASIEATSLNGDAIGMYAYGDQAIAANDGLVDALAYNGAAIGVYAFGYSTTAASNTATGSITATSYNGNAIGIGAGGYAIGVTNAGDIDVSGTTQTIGIYAQGSFDGATVDVQNSGSIHAAANFEQKYGMAAGVIAQADGNVIVGNAAGGLIDVRDGLVSLGTQANSQHGDVHVTNDGDITVSAFIQGAGIVAQSQYGDVLVDGSGNITVAGKYGVGILAQSNNGDATVHSGNDIGIDAQAEGFGIRASAEYGNALADNSGHVTVGGNEYGNVVGVLAEAGGSATATNTGDIAVSTHYGNAMGIYVGGATADVSSSGDITVHGGATAVGIGAQAGSALTVDNGGTLTVVQTGAGANAPQPIDVASGTGIGIAAYVMSGDATVTNGGTMSVTAYDTAIGIQLSGYDGALGVSNTGGITVAAANGDATGIDARGFYDSVAPTITVAHDGSITATSDTNTARGIFAMGDTVDVHGDGAITATGNAWGVGIDAVGNDVNVSSGGTMHVSVTGADADASGIYAYGAASLVVDNGGDITVTTPGTGSAYGIAAYSNVGDLAVGNSGTVHALGNDYAAGIVARTDGALTLDNAGHVFATAAQSAVGVAALGRAQLSNGGDISATSDGSAFGALLEADGDVSVDNGGQITATGAVAAALVLQVSGTSTVDNAGSLIAHGALENSFAIVGGAGIEHIGNTGNVLGAMLLGAGDDVFTNHDGGTWQVLDHSTDFGDGDDSIVNEAGGTIVMHDTAISLGSSSAAGNSFHNAGMLAVDGESSIDMGTGVVTPFAQPAQMFAVNAPIAVLNPNAFVNDGTISFLDGAPDDILTVSGDFAGDGAINVDVSMLHGTSDMLYVEGNVLNASHQLINVNVLDLPATGGDIAIPVVMVTGDSQAGQFTKGTFSIDNVLFSANNFLNLGVNVVERLSTDNAQADIFELALSFDGINDTGTTAASIAPGAQSLMASQVGTFRQRLGVFTQVGDNDVGAWVRVFRDKGSIDPDFHLDNLPQQGNFGFDQTNTGIEAGFTRLVTDHFFIGGSLATAKGKQSLSNGIGSDDLDGDTIGGYLTWLGDNGMYADLSYRWMHFEADMKSFGGQRNIGGDVGALNFEGGWNVWTSGGGLQLVPQVQYTRMTVQNIDAVHGDLGDFTTDGLTSSRFRAGLSLQQTFKTEKGSWTPYGTLSAIREFDGESDFAIANTFTGGTSIEGTSALLELGADVNMGRMHLYGGLNWMDGGAVDSVIGGQVGLRYTW
ncbi:hypothetical protein LVB87_02380 [Lysobacter sp. KIS68-7]|uniref:hypothetical protein n=1 Tax=Lysobacter sp. KIS68-7 TaxID=2904252 RepID=UPI001E2B6AE5|nr:hypothetical protein [Lysobacter sp. KIS68-7]UHQ20027.1 hypothetical protein LVB87_02380 [Lysobacter sp. KIS68-7]